MTFLNTETFAAMMTNAEGIQVYQKNQLTPERKQNLAEDLDRFQNADNMWNVLRQEFVLSHYEDNPAVQERIQWYLNHQGYLLRSANRAAPYLYYILQQVRKRHLPAELVLLPIVESSYNPFEYSKAGAAGIWQLMPDTASGYGVKQNWWYDGRRDVVTSTKAALNHLAYLGNFFDGNWLLALAAYDTGEGNVLAAIRKNVRVGMNTEYWNLPLAQETRDYVPQLLALAVIISHPDRYPILFPPVQNAPYLAQIDLGAQIDLKHAAYLAGLSLKQLLQLNPGYNRSATDPNGPYKLVLPIENVEQFTENLARAPLYQQVNWMHYRTRSSDSLASVARRFHTTIAALRSMNPTLAERVRPGTNLVIPRSIPAISETIMQAEQQHPVATVREHIVTNHVTTAHSVRNVLEHVRGRYNLQPGDTLYMVRLGDDLRKIANHFHTTVKTLLAVNQITSHSALHPGKQLIIPTHLSKVVTTKKYDLTPGDSIYVVRLGDDIEKIARKFHTTPSSIRLANLLANNTLQQGDRLVIPTHA